MIEVRRHLKDPSRTWKTGRIRVYVSGQDEPTSPVPGPSVRGDGSDADQAWRRYNREEIRLMREVVEEAFAADPELAEQLGKVVFSKKAGCSCGCSPGFIAEGRDNQDVWISRTPDEPAFQVGDYVQRGSDEAVGIVTAASTGVVVQFDDERYKHHFAWNLAIHDLTKTGVVVPDPNEKWLTAGA